MSIPHMTPSRTLESRGKSRFRAETNSADTFLHFCDVHGEVICDTRHGACLICLAELAHLSVFERYQKAGAQFYTLPCDLCGKETPHHIGTRQCNRCFDPLGLPRVEPAYAAPKRKSPSVRALARREGQQRYVDTCHVHGETPHGVRFGKCLRCYTVDGRPRRGSTPGHPSDRADARRAGKRLYNAPCEIHGQTPHYVSRGKCATCFNAAGYKRNLKPQRR